MAYTSTIIALDVIFTRNKFAATGRFSAISEFITVGFDEDVAWGPEALAVTNDMADKIPERQAG
jgi:hypothetical protein